MTAPLRFLLADTPREIRDIDPTMTVLQWLRTVEGRRGTKEGCAEGDCGACTVVVASPHGGGGPNGDGLRYQAVNACILFMGALHGKQVLTVEDLAPPGGDLHPVQRALVRRHGSQCGFCTPGFVMSLFALYHGPARPSRGQAEDALAGNLCRCTGYGPIVDAALAAGAGADRFSDGAAQTAARLRAMDRGETVRIGAGGRWFMAPSSVDALAEILVDQPDATIVAGATDVGLWVTKQGRVLDAVVHVGRVRELHRLHVTDDWIEIGAAVSYADAFDLLANDYADFGEVLRRLGSTQIRNAGTIGGNIANGSPIGDTPPLLIALGARLCLRRGGTRREIDLEDFYIEYGRQDRAPGEFVESVKVPRADAAWTLRAYKVSKRFDQDISALCGAFNLRIADGTVADARICYGGMAGAPRRARGAERALIGEPWSEATAAAAMDAMTGDYTPLSDMRASADYRMAAARNLLFKAFLETSGGERLRLVGAGAAASANHG